MYLRDIFVCYSFPPFYFLLFSGYLWRDHSRKLLVLVSWLCGGETGGAETEDLYPGPSRLKGSPMEREHALSLDLLLNLDLRAGHPPRESDIKLGMQFVLIQPSLDHHTHLKWALPACLLLCPDRKLVLPGEESAFLRQEHAWPDSVFAFW